MLMVIAFAQGFLLRLQPFLVYLQAVASVRGMFGLPAGPKPSDGGGLDVLEVEGLPSMRDILHETTGPRTCGWSVQC